MSKKKTKEEYVEELRIKNPNIELIGEYINDKTKTLHRCKKHNVVWDLPPNKALQGRGCRECSKEAYRKNRCKSEEDYIKELSLKNPTVKLKGRYINNKTAIAHYCEIHNITFDIRPNDALRGRGCRMCKVDKLRLHHLKSEVQYISELAIKNPTVKLYGKYIDCETPVEHYCEIHNIVWDITPQNALSGCGCKQCGLDKISAKNLRPLEQYIDELVIKNPKIKLVGNYINSKTPTEHYCEEHNVLFNLSPDCALRGYGCKQCASSKLREHRLKSESQYISELNKIHPNIILCGDYIGGHINTPHECLVCGCKWSPRPSNLLTGYGCPKCNESKGEKQVELWLEQKQISYICQKRFNDCCDKQSLPFDFYLPDYSICIEYQGKQHYEEIDYFGGAEYLLYVQHHDQIKKDYCLRNNIQLVCVPYWENVDTYLNKNLLI